MTNTIPVIDVADFVAGRPDALPALARQLHDAEKRRRADFVVDTSHGLDPVRAQIADILAAVVKMPKRRT